METLWYMTPFYMYRTRTIGFLVPRAHNDVLERDSIGRSHMRSGGGPWLAAFRGRAATMVDFRFKLRWQSITAYYLGSFQRVHDDGGTAAGALAYLKRRYKRSKWTMTALFS